jgi:chromatin remodeling complex protein RSC6
VGIDAYVMIRAGKVIALHHLRCPRNIVSVECDESMPSVIEYEKSIMLITLQKVYDSLLEKPIRL